MTTEQRESQQAHAEGAKNDTKLKRRTYNTITSSANENITIKPAPIREKETVSFPIRRRFLETYERSDDTVAAYLKAITRYPLLSKTQESIAFRYMAEGKSVEDLKNDQEFTSEYSPEDQEKVENLFFESDNIKNLIVNSNLRLIPKFVRGSRGKGLTHTELYQEGVFGLLTAVEKFEPELGFRFSTYAVKWISQKAQRASDEDGELIRMPSHAATSVNQARALAQSFSSKEGRLPIASELRELLMKEKGKSKGEADSILRLLQGPTGVIMSIDQERTIDKDDEDGSIKSTMADESEDTEDQAIENVSHSQMREILMGVLNKLPPKHKHILELRYGLDGEDARTLDQVGEIIKVSKEYVRQVEKKALKRLKDIISLEDRENLRILSR